MSRTRKRLAKQLGPIAILTAASAAALGFAGCSGEDQSVGTCVSTEQYFAEQVWAPILNKKCIACHTATGQAKASKMVLHASSEAGYLDTNLEIVKKVAAYKVNDRSELLLKPTNDPSVTHGGGLQVQKGGSEYAALEGLLARFDHPVDCETDVASFFADVQLAGWTKTLRKAALAVAGRVPTAAEAEAVEKSGEAGFDAVIDQMMTEDVFYERLKQMYNDQFLTDRYLGGDDALQLLGDQDGGYYAPKWYETATDPDLAKKVGALSPEDLQNRLEAWTNAGVAREPVELIAHVVKNNRPFTEILTANYMVVNPFSAKAYGVTDAKFTNDYDPTEFAEGHVGGYDNGYPHAGVLTSPMFLIRHPTTETNRNRHRSRMVYLFFLGTDILKTAEQPLDPTKITDFNPTMNNPSCTICHANVDPIAGAFHTFGAMGEYDPADKWLDDMRPPGFGSEQIPIDQFPTSLQWLASRVTADPRFALAAVYVMYEGLTGQKPLTAPSDSSVAGFSHIFQGYLAQYHTFNAIAKSFIASNYDLKVVVKAILKSPYFRAVNAKIDSADRKLELAELGTGQFVIPEQLNRKILSITGYPWRYDSDLLLDRDWYHILYGGIDSNDVVTRTRDPNGVMANIADRMSNEVSCLAVPHDFALPQANRRLFTKIEPSFEPKDPNGFDIVPAVKAIKEQIQSLHKQVLGEDLAIDDPEIERTYNLFVGIYEDGKKGMAKPEAEMPYSTQLPWPCQVHKDYWAQGNYDDKPDLPEDQQLSEDPSYTIRAWMGVMSYMLSDYAFIYE